jgi:hypothetical protein
MKQEVYYPALASVSQHDCHAEEIRRQAKIEVLREMLAKIELYPPTNNPYFMIMQETLRKLETKQ